RLAGLDLDRTSSIGVRHSAPTGGSLVAPEDAVVSTKEPRPPRPAARKDLQGVEPVSKPICFQHGSRRCKVVPFLEHQGTQEVVRRYRNETLGEPFQENLCSLGILIEQGSGGGEQQDEAVARMRAHRLFGLWQKPRGAVRIGEGGHQDLIPSVDRLRLIAEGQNRLCRRSTRHAKSFCLRLPERARESTTRSAEVTWARPAIKRVSRHDDARCAYRKPHPGNSAGGVVASLFKVCSFR